MKGNQANRRDTQHLHLSCTALNEDGIKMLAFQVTMLFLHKHTFIGQVGQFTLIVINLSVCYYIQFRYSTRNST